MNDNPNKAMLVVPILVLGVALFVYLDTSAYRTAVREFKVVASPAVLKHELNTTSKDFGKVVNCDSQSVQAQLTARDNDWRSCFVPVLHSIESEGGAIVATMHAISWLKKHPKDSDMRSAATYAISRGWTAYERNLPVLTAQQRVIDARHKSKVLRLVDGQIEAGSLVEIRAQVLRKIEADIAATNV